MQGNQVSTTKTEPNQAEKQLKGGLRSTTWSEVIALSPHNPGGRAGGDKCRHLPEQPPSVQVGALARRWWHTDTGEGCVPPVPNSSINHRWRKGTGSSRASVALPSAEVRRQHRGGGEELVVSGVQGVHAVVRKWEMIGCFARESGRSDSFEGTGRERKWERRSAASAWTAAAARKT